MGHLCIKGSSLDKGSPVHNILSMEKGSPVYKILSLEKESSVDKRSPVHKGIKCGQRITCA